jgi:hypothetical protein
MSQNGKTKMHLQTKEMKNNGDIITQFDDTDATQKELSERLKAKHQYYLYSLLNNRYFIK